MLIVKTINGSTFNFKENLKFWDINPEAKILRVDTKNNESIIFPLCNVIVFSFEEESND